MPQRSVSPPQARQPSDAGLPTSSQNSQQRRSEENADAAELPGRVEELRAKTEKAATAAVTIRAGDVVEHLSADDVKADAVAREFRVNERRAEAEEGRANDVVERHSAQDARQNVCTDAKSKTQNERLAGQSNTNEQRPTVGVTEAERVESTKRGGKHYLETEKTLVRKVCSLFCVVVFVYFFSDSWWRCIFPFALTHAEYKRFVINEDQWRNVKAVSRPLPRISGRKAPTRAII